MTYFRHQKAHKKRMEHTDQIQSNIDQMIPTDSPLHQSVENARTSASKSASKLYQLSDSVKNIVRDFVICIFTFDQNCFCQKSNFFFNLHKL